VADDALDEIAAEVFAVLVIYLTHLGAASAEWAPLDGRIRSVSHS
jgi:hypothetical protein